MYGLNQSNLSQSEVNTTNAVSQPAEPNHCSNFPDLYFDAGNSSSPYLVNFGLNFFLSLTGVIGNTLILLAIRKITCLHKPSKVLLSSLVLTDLGVGAIVEPSYMAYLYTKVSEGLSTRSCWSATVANVFGSSLACVSFMTLTAISVDRYVALYYNVRYRSIVTTKRVYQALVVVWSVSIFWGTSLHWCFSCHYPICITIMAFCIPLSSFCYLKIFLRLRQQQKQRKKQLGPRDQGAAQKLTKYRSTTISMLMVYVLLLICYTPYLCLVLLTELDGISIYRFTILEYASALTFFNSTFNPLVYCWRIKEVRATLLGYARKVLPCRSAPTNESATGVPNSGGLVSFKVRNIKVAPLQQNGKQSTHVTRVLESSRASGIKEDIMSIIHLSH